MTGGRTRRLAGLIAFAALWLPAHAAGAANSPTFRDCSFLGGLDPDFVKLTGATPGPNGTLTVASSQSSVTIEASESSDPGDSAGHDTFSVTVTGTGTGTKTVSGTGTGHVTLTVPLSGVAPGGQYSLSWSATFDNGFHHCPGSMTPQNPTSSPFVLSVAAGASKPAPKITALSESRRRWSEPTGTTFRFKLNQRAGVTLVFRQRLHGRSIPRGALLRKGRPGLNVVRFDGDIPHQGRLAPGRYVLIVTAANAAGERSNPASISFVIRPPSAPRG
jgi:hypothetical protein